MATKRLWLIGLVLLLSATLLCAGGLKKHIVFAMKKSTWQDASPVKKEAIKTFFARFTDAPIAIKPVIWVQTSNTNIEWMVAAYWTEHLVDKAAENITTNKIAILKAQLNDAGIRVVTVDNAYQALIDAGLQPPSGGP